METPTSFRYPKFARTIADTSLALSAFVTLVLLLFGYYAEAVISFGFMLLSSMFSWFFSFKFTTNSSDLKIENFLSSKTIPFSAIKSVNYDPNQQYLAIIHGPTEKPTRIFVAGPEILDLATKLIELFKTSLGSSSKRLSTDIQVRMTKADYGGQIGIFLFSILFTPLYFFYMNEILKGEFILKYCILIVVAVILCISPIYLLLTFIKSVKLRLRFRAEGIESENELYSFHDLESVVFTGIRQVSSGDVKLKFKNGKTIEIAGWALHRFPAIVDRLIQLYQDRPDLLRGIKTGFEKDKRNAMIFFIPTIICLFITTIGLKVESNALKERDSLLENHGAVIGAAIKKRPNGFCESYSYTYKEKDYTFPGDFCVVDQDAKTIELKVLPENPAIHKRIQIPAKKKDFSLAGFIACFFLTILLIFILRQPPPTLEEIKKKRLLL